MRRRIPLHTPPPPPPAATDDGTHPPPGPPPGPPPSPRDRLAVLARHLLRSSSPRAAPSADAPPLAVCITGLTSGLGWALALEFARRGHRVVGCGRRAPRLAALREALAHASPLLASSHVLLEADVGSAASVSNFMREVVYKRLIVPDLLVCNAGTNCGVAPLWDVPVASFDTVVQTNLNGVFYTVRAFAPVMLEASRKAGAAPKRIVAMSSGLGHSTSPVLGPYSATKFGVEALMKSLAQSFRAQGADNIAAYPLAPGVVQTEMMTNPDWGPPADEWAVGAVPFILGLSVAESGSSVCVPGGYSSEYMSSWIIEDGQPLPDEVVSPKAVLVAPQDPGDGEH